jgi:hypothetical protein
MGCSCSIYKKSLFLDAKIETFNIETSWLKNLIPSFEARTSGLWLPIIIKPSNSNIEYTDIFTRAESEQGLFDPCNCSISENTVDDPENDQTYCSYCSTDINNSYSIGTWKLTDKLSGKNVSVGAATCCDGACDVRISKDDYLAKLPSMNSSYLKQPYDLKYKKQFPACSNLGLGKEKFAYSTSYDSFKAEGPEIVVDWKIKERLSEIPPNDIDSYHKDIDTHEKSYKRSLITSKTCGNFILTKLSSESGNNPYYPLFSGIIGDIQTTGNYSKLLPSVKNFTKPYGFKNQDHYNIFVKTEKVGSHWKWNYSSGVLCWYRYFDVDATVDDRLIRGVDLYISDGDVFYATNDGPENSSSSYNENNPSNNEIHQCPSGLKLVKNSRVTGILPNNSEFLYISENIYGKFYSILNKIEDLEVSLDIDNSSKLKPLKKLELAALLATGPNYHEVTVDLLKTVQDLDDATKDYERDPFKQIISFNKAMLSKPQYKLNKLNIVKTSGDLVNTLANKYGAYIWFPPNTEKKLELLKSCQPHAYLDLDFEPVVKDSDTRFTTECKSKPPECGETVVSKTFAYNQEIKVGNFVFKTDVDKRYKSYACTSGNFTIDKTANIISAYFNNNLIKESYYGSGCTRFYQKYLRVPSYDLAYKKLGDSLCEDSELCDSRLSKIYNKPSGEFEDKSVILDRRYPANYCNSNVDRIGFNKQGGLYYDSNIFGSDNVVFVSTYGSESGNYSVSFKTKDVGIKLYNLEICKLRDEKNAGCKTFPLNQACKCFPLSYVDGYRYNCNGTLTFTNGSNILYTPNLSTQSSPVIKSHGGFSIQEVDQILGSGNRIQNHPSPNTDLSKVNRIIDPLHPYECQETITVNFPNYIYTKWGVTLPTQYNTSHADIWMKINETVDLFKPTNTFLDEEDELVSEPNKNYRRFTTKVDINKSTIYGSQQNILFSKDTTPSFVNIEFTNPFLYSLLSQMSSDINKNKILYTPLPCSLDVDRNQTQDPFDSYLIKSISIIFQRLPRKQFLAYKFKPLNSIGTLNKTFFHPNSGLVSDFADNKTSLLFNSGICTFDFDYERQLFNNGSTSYSDSGIIYSGVITTQVKRILNSVDNLLNHKKLRLYIKYNDVWYEYTNPHVFGYYNQINNTVYPSYPMYFEYSKEEKYKTQLNISVPANSRVSGVTTLVTTEPSILIPVSAKKNIEFKYVYNAFNHQPKIESSNNQNIPLLNSIVSVLPNNNYPVFDETFAIDKNSNNKIVIPGTRAYFLIEEEDKAEKLLTTIQNMSETDQEKIHKNTFVIDVNKTRFRYKGEGSKTDEKSYEKVPPRDYRDNNFSEEYIKYSKTNKTGYVANTNVPTKLTEIILLSFNNPYLLYRYKVKSKKIIAPKGDKYGNDISIFATLKPNEYLKTFTVLELDGVCEECEIPLKEGYVKLVDPDGSTATPESIILFQDLKNLVKSENDSFLSNRFIQTKWGDVLRYDGNVFQDLNNSLTVSNTINNLYPSSLYDNIFHNISINNTNTGNFNAFIVSRGTGDGSSVSGALNHSGLVYYNMHQIYNIGLNKYLENIVSNYQNYLPFLDINFFNSNYIRSQSWFNNITNNYENNLVSAGEIYISGIREYVRTKELKNNPESGSTFFISIDKNQYLQPVLFNNNFYYDSLRVDDVYYRLASLSKEEAYNNSGCRSIFKPSISFGATTFPHFFNTSAFCISPITGHYFENIPIYCDMDKIGKCANEQCGLKTVGWTKLRAGYNHYEYPFITAKVLESSSNVEYALSVDEGLYNVIGNDSIPYIQRFEIEPKSNLFPDTTLDKNNTCIKGNDARPPRPQNYIDHEYQNKLKNYILSEDNKGDLVKNTDILANEMLFRTIYGAKQQIEYDTIKKKTVKEAIQYKTEKSISYLLQYAEPKTTPDLIYKLIPYDYSIQSDTSKRKIQGTISIDGVLKIGKNVSVKIGNATLSVSVQKIEGKIYAIGSLNGIKASGMIHDEDNIQYGLVPWSTGSSPGNTENTRYRKLQRCDIPDTYSWSKSKHFTTMKYSDGITTVDVVAEYLKCMTKLAQEKTCVNRIDWGGNPPDWSVLSGGTVDCVGSPPCVGCYSRGYAPGPGQYVVFGQVEADPRTSVLASGSTTPPVSTQPSNLGVNGGAAREGSLEIFNSMSPNCTVITTRSSKVSVGGLGRGSFGNGSVFGDCPVRQNASISTSPCQLGGDFDSVLGGLAVMNLFGHRNCTTAPSPCKGTCTPLDFEDKYGKVNTPARYATGPDGSRYPICECTNYNYGYCDIPDTTCSCPEYYRGFPKIFEYDFEYCNYNFTKMRGNIWKHEDGEPPVWGGTFLDIECKQADLDYGNATGEATEECYWVECLFPSESKDIYEAITTNPNPYKPLCPTNLCSISYDNNTITLSLPGSTTCFNNNIRTKCPEITITLPDSTFTFTDTITSECTECSVEKNAIKTPTSQNPKWDIITETRTAILNWTLPIEGDKNVDAMGGGGAVYVDKHICGDTGPCCCDNCYSGTGGMIQCGRSAPDSWVWWHGLACNLNGSPGPQFAPCKKREGQVGMKNLRSGIGFYTGSDNGKVKARVIQDWKNQVAAIYKTYAPCFNHKDGSINVEDLVEGVVPGSCSDLQFAVASYPMVAWRKTLDGGEQSQGTYGVHYAYFTYQYRRPRTIQDVLLGEEISNKCSTAIPILPTDGYNITEKYEIKNCDTIPNCYDTKPDVCDKEHYCCRTGQNRRDI